MSMVNASVIFVALFKQLEMKPVALKAVEDFMHRNESLFHPSNQSDNTKKLAIFVWQLALKVTKMQRKFPNQYLSPEELELFVMSLQRPCFLLIMQKNKDILLNAALCINCLACLRPKIMIPAVVEFVSHGFQQVNEVQMHMSSLGMLSTLTRTMITSDFVKESPDGLENIRDFLTIALECINPSDWGKTIASMAFSLSFNLFIFCFNNF